MTAEWFDRKKYGWLVLMLDLVVILYTIELNRLSSLSGFSIAGKDVLFVNVLFVLVMLCNFNWMLYRHMPSPMKIVSNGIGLVVLLIVVAIRFSFGLMV
jgi:hypothetical protein